MNKTGDSILFFYKKEHTNLKTSAALTKAYIEIKRIAEKYPDNKFLAISAEMTPKDYHTDDLENTEYMLAVSLKSHYQIYFIA